MAKEVQGSNTGELTRIFTGDHFLLGSLQLSFGLLSLGVVDHGGLEGLLNVVVMAGWNHGYQ